MKCLMNLLHLKLECKLSPIILEKKYKMIELKLTKIFEIMMYVVFGMFAVYLLSYHVQLIFNPYPAEYREAAIVLSTDLLLNGKNQFALIHQPIYTNTYGIIYHLAVYPLAKLFGSSFAIHRFASGIFLLVSLLLIHQAMLREKFTQVYIFCSLLFIYANMLLTVTPLSRPDTLGFLFMIVSILNVRKNEFSMTSIMISIIAGLCAFYTKSYFAIGTVSVIMYLFLFHSKRKGLIAAAVFALLLIISAIFMHNAFESYFSNTLFSHIGSGIGYSRKYKLHVSSDQLVNYVFLFRGLSLSAITLCIALIFKISRDIYFKRSAITIGKSKLFNFKDMNQPLIQEKFNYLSLFPLLSTFVCSKFFLVDFFSDGSGTGTKLLQFSIK